MKKLNLGCGADIRSHDYLNVDDQPNPDCPAEMFRQGDLANLDWLCDDGSVEDILALNTLSRFSFGQVKEVLANWVRKLAPGGILKLSFLDLAWLVDGLANEAIDMAQLNAVIYDSRSRSGLDEATVRDYLQSLGMEIGDGRCQDYSVYIEASKAVRP